MNNKIGYIIHEAPAIEAEVKLLKQDKNRMVAEAILQDADVVNRNTRCYKLKDLTREISSPRIQELIEAKEFKGEAGHPTDQSITRQQTVMPSLCCFKILKIWVEGNLVKALVKGTNNALGEEFDLDLREGASKAFSLRALGSIMTEGGRNYVDNLKIITYDHVIFPSHKVAYTTKLINEAAKIHKSTHVLNESGVYVPENKILVNEGYEGSITPITNDSVISYIKSESANIKNITNTFDTIMESITLTEDGRSVRLLAKNGDMIIVHMETYIQNEIMDYCTK